MEIKQTKKSDSVLEIVFTFDSNDIKPVWEKTINRLGQDMELPGFRKGKIPQNILEEKLGKDYIFEEAAKALLQDEFSNYILKNNIDIIDKPEVTLNKIIPEQYAEFVAKITIIPELDLPDYKQIAEDVAKSKKQIEVSEKEITDTLDWIRDSRSKLEEVDKKIEVNDVADINFEILYNNQPLDGGKEENYKFVVGKEPVFQELNKELMGLGKGDEKEFEITIPKDWPDETLQNKKAIMKVKVNAVLKKNLPELNDEFAKSLGDFENLEALNKSIKEGIHEEKENKEKEKLRLLLLEQIREKIKNEIPEVLISKELEYVLEELKHKVEDIGLEFSQYLAQIKKTEEQIREELRDEAKKRVLNALILREIIKRENIKVSSEELQKKVNELLINLSYQVDDPNKIDREALEGYAQELCENEKAFDLLLNQ